MTISRPSVDLLMICVILLMVHFGSCVESVESDEGAQIVVAHRDTSRSLFDLANQLRKMVADTMDEGSLTHPLCEGFVHVDFESFDRDVYLRMFAKDSCRARCGLAANILVKLLDESGITSCTYNFGFEGTDLTHVVVLAQVDGGVWSVQDPTFNYSVLDSDGNPKDFFELIRNFSRGFLDDTHVTQDTVWRSLLLDTEKPYPLSITCSKILRTLSMDVDNHATIRRPVCYGCSLGGADCPELDFIARMETRLAVEGFYPHFLMGLLMPINKVWGPEAEDFQLIVDSAFNNLQCGI